MSKPLKIFITYSHKDKAAKNELIMRLDVMKKQDMIKIWHDNEILPGDKWYEDISNNLADSDILLYLVSASSLASENCNKELGEALDVDKKVIPIILEDCDWQKHQLGAIEALPDKGKSINEWQPESKGWQNVVDGIRKVVGEMQTQAFDSAHQEALPEWIFQQGNFLMMIGQIDKAIEAYSHVIKRNPRYPVAYYNRGRAYHGEGELDRAIRDYSKAIELKPDFAEAYQMRGIVYYGKGDYDRAIKDYNKVIELEPNNAKIYNIRGVTSLHLRNWNNARSDLTIAKYMGVDIISIFRELHNNVAEFERIYAVKLPEDIAAMLTQG